MELDLSKSESLSLGDLMDFGKSNPSLKIAQVGLGWNTNETPGGPNFDLDVSAFLLGANGKVPGVQYVVFYGTKTKNEEGRPYSGDGSVLGAVDAIGDEDEDEEGDKEDMIIYFDHVAPEIKEIAITVTITKYPNDKHKDPRTSDLNFGMVDNCYIRMWDAEKMEEIFRYDLQSAFSSEDAVIFGRFIKNNDNEWSFKATGEGHNGSLGQMAKIFG
jgi:tellurium resistance protein TerD